MCVLKIKYRKHIEQNFHSVAKVMPRVGTSGCGGVKNFSVGICDGAPSTARSNFVCSFVSSLIFVAPIMYGGFLVLIFDKMSLRFTVSFSFGTEKNRILNSFIQCVFFLIT